VPQPAARPCPRHSQLRLFPDALPRVYSYRHPDDALDGDAGPTPEPDNEWLAWGLYLAHTMAETRGWRPSLRRGMRRTLVMLLSEHADGDVVRTSDFHTLVAGHSTNLAHTRQILDTMGVLLDDRPTSFQRWLDTSTADLTPGIGRDTRRWATTLHKGGPRTHPRGRDSVTGYLRSARPALIDWSSSYLHLREVTRSDVLAHLDTLDGHRRQAALTALRSLFTWAKRNNLIFRDPTTRIPGTKRPDIIWQPLRPNEIRQTIDAATTPQARLLVALTAIHAARSGQIRALRLDDVDLPERRLRIAGHDRPLDDLTHQLLLAWLDHRRDQWPRTANTHLLISRQTAVGLGPVSAPWANQILRGLPATLDRLHTDRRLDEALTHDADPLHLTSVFGVSPDTAIRDATNAAHLLAHHDVDDTPPSAGTQGSTADNGPNEHPGSS
jgi:integrase